MSKSEIMVGVPSACILPAARYQFRQMSDLLTITLPARGFFPEESPFNGQFDIAPEPGVFLFGKITEVLFAFDKYPKLEENQRFVLSGVELDDEDQVNLVGKIFEFVEVESSAE